MTINRLLFERAPNVSLHWREIVSPPPLSLRAPLSIHAHIAHIFHQNPLNRPPNPIDFISPVRFFTHLFV